MGMFPAAINLILKFSIISKYLKVCSVPSLNPEVFVSNFAFSVPLKYFSLNLLTTKSFLFCEMPRISCRRFDPPVLGSQPVSLNTNELRSYIAALRIRLSGTEFVSLFF